MTNNKAYDFFFKINKNNDVTENQIVESLSILLEKYHDIQTYEWHKNLKIVLNITLSSEPHSTILDSEASSAIMSVTNLFSINWNL